MLFAWTFSGVVDWLQGSPRGPGEMSALEDRRRQARPRPRSIPWRPAAGEEPSELFETGWADEVYILQPVFQQIRSHAPENPGEQRYGFLLGRRLECPATGDPYLLIDEGCAVPDPLRERGGAEEFEKALEEARDRATEGEKDVLGWFHTHSPFLGLRMTEHDVRLHSRFFPERWHCALIEVVHGEEPLGGLFQRRQKHRYPGTRLVSFLEVVERNGSRDWGTMESQLDWTNYETPRRDVRRAAPPRQPAPVTRARRRMPAAGTGDREPVQRQPPAEPSWNWLPPGGPDATEAGPAERPGAERRAAERAAAEPAAVERPAAEPAATRRERCVGGPVPDSEDAALTEKPAHPARFEAVPRSPSPSVPPRPASGRKALRFTLEPSEASVSGGRLSRAVDGLRAVVAARRRAATDSPIRAVRTGPSTFDEDALPVENVPVVMPTGDEWPQRLQAARVSLRKARRTLVLLPLVAIAVFFLFRADGGTEPLAPGAFHPAAGPPEAASTAGAARAEFERRRASLSEALAAYNDRRAEFDLGAAGCSALAAAHRTAQRDFVRLSDLVAREETPLGGPQREAWRDLAAETAAMDRHLEDTGCESGSATP